MMRKYLPVILFFCASMVFSCKKNIDFGSSNQRKTSLLSGRKSSDSLVVLGKKLENPYSLENMKKAISKVRSASLSELKPTHLYVRFLPKNSDEVAILYQDTTLIYSTIPVGYEVLKEGDYYHDPSIPKGQITWLYATVTPDYEFPKMKYEILEELYKPKSDDVEFVSLAMTGNIGDAELQTKVRAATSATLPAIMAWFGARKYNPSGHNLCEK